jgi:small-conductance mechanosensitive channel
VETLPVEEIVNTTLLFRGAVTAVIVVVAAAILFALKAAIIRFVDVRQMHRLRGRFVYRTARTLTIIFAVFLLAYAWGVTPENLWVLVTGFVGLVAVAFFAVWSLLSNIVAGFFLFLSDPFKINDEIELPEVSIEGKVLDIRPLFVILEEPSGHVTFVPNNVLFQKSFRRFNPDVRARERAEAEADKAAAETEAQGAD